ncbi:MAG TPA: ATP-binding protein [Pseudogracilibacillus sp.]|nr:ATP-binding protein [Pseudogracilibacillus sp.]
MNKFFKPTRLKTWQIFVLLGVFLLILTIGRLWWANTFSNPKEVHVKDGFIDLSDWEDSGEILSLNGEWDFYPNRFAVNPTAEKEEPAKVSVPDGWTEDIFSKEEKEASYGYGTYRLQIRVDPDNEEKYSIQFPSIRSSSILYINGEVTEQVGTPSDSKDTYKAQNKPFKTTLHPDENGIIDIAVQVANFDDIRKGGIIRTPKFGEKHVLNNQFDLSIFMQILVIVLLILHSIYAITLFFLGHRSMKIIYTALLFLSVAVIVGLGFNEKIFTKFFFVDYSWLFKLLNISGLFATVFLLLITDYKKVYFWHKLHPWYIGIVIVTAIIILFSDVSMITAIIPVIYSVVFLGFIVAFAGFIQMMRYQFQKNILLLFALIAMGSYSFWTLYWMSTGINVPYYPFEMIIALLCTSALWFLYFFRVYQESQNLALELQEINASKDQFLANTAHEFKNPLHSILNITQSVLKKEKYHLDKNNIEGLTTVLSVGERLSILLEDLLDVQYLQKHSPVLHKKAVHLPAVVTGMLDMLKYNTDIKQITLKNEVPQDFPPVLADENRLVQILYNLLDNSVKFTEAGSVSVKASVQEDAAYITIADTGIGMEQTFIDNLFQPYEQGEAGTSYFEGGFGLGLHITKQLVELHEGTISADSTLHEGTEITFTLQPAEKKDEDIFFESSEQSIQHIPVDQVLSEEVPEHLLPQQNTLTKPNVLVVDDNPVNLQVIGTLLQDDEFNVQKVTNGENALHILHTRNWDLVITDVMMPGMSGYKLTAKIRERFQLMELPVLLLTAKSQPSDYQKGFVAGANDYVVKPVEAVEFKARVNALITMKQTTENQQQLETAWLQAQIQPHFIFNVLNSIIALSEIDLDRMRSLTHEFSTFLRSKFEFQHMQELIPLAEEMELVKSYVYIEQVRFQNRLQVEWDIGDMQYVYVPHLSIQPLVENAINHGVMARSSGGTVWITVIDQTDYTEIFIEDNGVGMKSEQIKELFNENKQSGVGVVNTNQRLKKHFGQELYVESKFGEGTKFYFRIPNHTE